MMSVIQCTPERMRRIRVSATNTTITPMICQIGVLRNYLRHSLKKFEKKFEKWLDKSNTS